MQRLLASWTIGLGLSFATAAAGAVTYADLAPLLGARCVMCHAGLSAAAGLRLDSLEGVLAGSAKGKIVKAGDPDGSELVRRLKGTRAPACRLTARPGLATRKSA